MTWDDPFFYPHMMKIRDVTTGGMGTTPGAARDVRCEVRDEQRLVRTADGAEVVSSSQVTVPSTEVISLGSHVTVWPGQPGEREATVLAVGRNENDDDLDSFVVLWLT